MRVQEKTREKKERSFSLSYTGPAKPVPVRTGVTFNPSLFEALAYAACAVVVLLDVFVWRP